MVEPETGARFEPRFEAKPYRHALLLQGPMGPFFRRLGEELEQHGLEVTHVVFHPADELFLLGRKGIVRQRGSLEEWPETLRKLVRERRPDVCFLFGDERPLHRAAVPVLEAKGVDVYVFEEGYLRPDFITLEPHGVNGNSRLPRTREAYQRALETLAPPRPAMVVGPTFGRAALYATVYSIALTFLGWLSRGYGHHRPLNAFREAFCWVRSGLRKLVYARREAALLPRFTGELHHRYFLLPLQVHNDAQFEHAEFSSAESFLEHAVEVFAKHARPEDALVVKHHPMDRGYREYGHLVDALREKHGLGDRLHYVHDLHLPTLLDHARGVITMNSTTGLQALFRGCPTKVLGRSIYDVPGLASQQTMEAFLHEPKPPNPEMYEGFERYLRHHVQPNGNFVRRLEKLDTPTGVRWHPRAPYPLGARAREAIEKSSRSKVKLGE